MAFFMLGGGIEMSDVDKVIKELEDGYTEEEAELTEKEERDQGWHSYNKIWCARWHKRAPRCKLDGICDRCVDEEESK